MAVDKKTLAVAEGYVNDTIGGAGALAGKNCTITDITHDTTNKVNKVTFSWTENDGTVKTQVMSVPDGIDGANGNDGADGLNVKSAAIDSNKHLILTLSDDTTTIDAGLIPEQTVDLSGYVQKETGKGLSTNDYTTADKTAVGTISNKVDKVTGKGLSTNDYDATEKAEVAKIKDKVDKVTGKGLSTNDYDDTEKAQVAKIAGKIDRAQGTVNAGKILVVGSNGNVTLERRDVVSAWETTPVDTNVPSEKLVKDNLDAKADKTVEKVVVDNWSSTGYNLIPFPYADENTVTRGGITFTVNEDGTVKANGTSTGGAWLYLWNYQQGLLIEKGKTYVISDGIDNSDYRMELAFYKNGSSVGTSILDNGNGTKFTAPNDDTYDSVRLALWVRTGSTAINVVYKPMLVEVNADGTYPTEYQRYAKGNVELANYLDEQVERGYLRNKNLVDGVLNAVIDSSGTITSGTGDKTTVIFYALANTKYTVSGANRDRSRVAKFTEKPTIGSKGTVVIDSDNVTSFTTSVGGWYAWYMSSTSDSAPQVENGDSATKYVAPNGKSNKELTEELTTKELTFSSTVFEDNSKIKVHRVGNVVQVSFFGAKTNAKISKYGILVTNIPKSLSYVGHYIDCGSTSSSIYMNGDTTRIQSNAEINIGDELWGSLVYISK